MNIRELIILLRADILRLSNQPAGVGADFKPSWLKIFSPRFIPVLLARVARYFYLNRYLRFFSPILTWLNVVIFGIEITARCEIGPGLMLPHTYGTVIGSSSIGNNATIFHGVTLGAKYPDLLFDVSQRPTVGDNVVIGAGAKILGGIHLGNNSTVAANSLVLFSVPESNLAIGVPAEMKLKN
ncbi:serine O-acetyltransferase [Glaciimonas immobilis]|uniref:Serine O-acetyltransferase n=1 Tax=Glaciimonas immobilis TaxID=728004 RepID=A0A840RWP2_9BURK|nr:DapH/DapD/GlmU-related protein [Glaciimonas immobilis]KAF3997449.1 serine acetyltransferase [Glaciimonas immobilis]MBB5200880.1 serine O-acetyltransferase [Glaciimonas immobilis]